jgi:hypothetical protein
MGVVSKETGSILVTQIEDPCVAALLETMRKAAGAPEWTPVSGDLIATAMLIVALNEVRDELRRDRT